MHKLSDLLPGEWQGLLKQEFEKPYFNALSRFLEQEWACERVFPARGQLFRAFELCPPQKTKVIVLGQDPYHGQGQANGLAFSVNEGVRIPPSLLNVYKELKSEFGYEIPMHGNLQKWASQGVLLINATLTVRENQAGSHQNKGWEQFTDAVIRAIAHHRSHLVFMLWGNFARRKKSIQGVEQHYVLEAAHPSPLSASRGFFGCRHFSKANQWLHDNNLQTIDWEIPVITLP